MLNDVHKEMRVMALIGIGVIVLIALVLVLLTQVHANWDNHRNHCWENCWKPTPTLVLPIPTIELTPTVEVPTATPSASPMTPQGTTGGNSPQPQGNSSTTNALAAVTCNIAFSAPVLTSITAGASGTLNLNWLESESSIDKFSIIYGLVGQPLLMGEDNIPSSSRSLPINGLPKGSHINAQVWAWKNGCAEMSNIVDPKVR